MTTPVHTDLTSFLSTPAEIYTQLSAEQERDVLRHQIAQSILTGLTLLSALGFSKGWEASPWLAATAVFALERTLWLGRELSNRNYTMHLLTFQMQANRSGKG